MYHALMKVIMRGEGRGEQETKPPNAKEPQSTTTGLQPVLLHLTMLNCKQFRMASVRPTM
jgi:hypothetical protein